MTAIRISYKATLSQGFDDPNMVLTLGQLTTARHALLGAKNAAEAVAAAIRTVRDLGNSGRNGDVALRDANQAGG